MSTGLERLGPRQRRLVADWLPGVEVVHDHSWGLVDRVVLELESGGQRFILKAGGPDDHHQQREVRAHLEWLEPWTARGLAPRLAHHDLDANLLVTRHLPGVLVEGTSAADDPRTYRQAGRLLALLHQQAGVEDPGHEARENARSLAWLDGPHRIDPRAEDALRAQLASWPTPPALLVPTHGDWQPRNWLVDDGVVRAIDFGRAALRPAASDLTRLAAHDFRRDPAFEVAFLDGYGDDPREAGPWHRLRVREAIGTAAWAHVVGDEAFEEQGHRMIADVLAPD